MALQVLSTAAGQAVIVYGHFEKRWWERGLAALVLEIGGWHTIKISCSHHTLSKRMLASGMLTTNKKTVIRITGGKAIA